MMPPNLPRNVRRKKQRKKRTAAVKKRHTLKALILADAAFELEDFQFGVGQHGGKEMGGLRGQGLGG